MGADIPTQGEDGGEVDLDDIVEVGVGEGFAGVTALDASAVDEYADLVVVGENTGDEGGYVSGRGQVGRVDLGYAVEGLDRLESFCVGCVALSRQLISSYKVRVSGWRLPGLEGRLHRLPRERWLRLDQCLVSHPLRGLCGPLVRTCLVGSLPSCD